MGLRGSGHYVLGMATAPQGSYVGSVGVRATGGKHLENELQCGQGPCLRPQCSQEAAGTLPSSRGSHHTTTIRASPRAGLQPPPRCWEAPFKALQPLLSVALVEAASQAPQKLTLPVSPLSTPRPLPARVPLPSLCLHFPFCLECPLQPFHPPLPGRSSSTISLRDSLEVMP